MPRTSVISAFINDNASGGATGPDGTQYYVELTIQSSQVSSDLTNFPVYVDLSDMPSAFFANVQSDGGDIRVTESDGTTRCAVELVSIDTGASTGELHFLASSVSSSSDTTFRIYYDAGGGLSQPGVATTYGRNAVWSDYVGVWHMEEDPSGTAPQIVDSTGNGHDGTSNGAMTSGDSVTGQLSKALDFDGSDDFIDLGDMDAGLSSTLTVSSWVKTSNLHRVWSQTNTSSDTPMLLLNVQSGHATFGNGINFFIRDASSNRVEAYNTGTVSDGAWHHVVGILDGTTADAYVDGSGPGVNSWTGTLSLNASTFDKASVAALQRTSTSVTQGQADEVRVRESVLSADWIASEYTNQNATTTFYTVGSQTAV